ncbi:hypothetical protein NA78x_002799 [Anatilimnocola sp. NA78]|uniref:RipA family octameric membrane protein n=1 Tax=Anatilimnocola sp. NA78 TaxID=3415683 RepID=UPI003CE51106
MDDDWKALEYAWKYFDRHAEQRLKTFNFYLLLCGAIIAGICGVLREPKMEWMTVVLASILSFVSFVFWKLDRRNRTLTKRSEQALQFLEDKLVYADGPDGVPHICKLFQREAHDRERAHVSEYSYSRCFGLVFALFGFGGFASAAYSFLTWLQH